MPKAKLTEQQIKHILKVHATAGPAASSKLGVRYGVHESYASKLAAKHRVRAPGSRYYPGYPRDEDPRWERAKAIGMVVV